MFGVQSLPLGYAPAGPAVPGPRFQATLTKVTSAIVGTQLQTVTFTGTLEQLEDKARSAFIHNLLAGWWGIPWGLIRTPMALFDNSSAMKKVRALAAQQASGQAAHIPPEQAQPWQARPSAQKQPPKMAPGQPWSGMPREH